MTIDLLSDHSPLVGSAFPGFNRSYRLDEGEVARGLLSRLSIADELRKAGQEHAGRLIGGMRERAKRSAALDTLLAEYKLTSREGLALMSLAEALLRIPDRETADILLREKLASGNWRQHIGKSSSLVINASAVGLSLAGWITRSAVSDRLIGSIVGRLGEPVVRRAVSTIMQLVSRQFVAGANIGEALTRNAASPYRFSYDMLGEAAMTAKDTERFFKAYVSAVEAIASAETGEDLRTRPGISVKLSALHPRYEYAQQERVVPELTDRLHAIAVAAAKADIGLTVDAEEAERLELSLECIRRVAESDELGSWRGFGLVVQGYSKRSLPVLDWLEDLTKRTRRPMQVRLAKGGYWDTEIKLAQVKGLDGYPVFTRKTTTDVSYLVCAERLLATNGRLYPMFATHNALTIATILQITGPDTAFEFQRLHGMGKTLYDQIINGQLEKRNIACRVYAPVGKHNDLLPYLVRRLIENGATSSFVSQIVDSETALDALLADPPEKLSCFGRAAHPGIRLPSEIFAPERKNAMGLDLTDHQAVEALAAGMRGALARDWLGQPIVGGEPVALPARQTRDPANQSRLIGSVIDADEATADRALHLADRAYADWDNRPATERAACLDRAADLIEKHMPELMAMLVREAGKTVPDTIADIREAVDFCRYYAARARTDLAKSVVMQGPTGEENELTYHGRGVFVCISPWNFPVAIFTGQIAAALVAGNTVIAKPAEQTPIVATAVTKLLHEAGVPVNVLHLLPGPGETIGARLCRDARVAGVAFTGSTETALSINRALAARGGFVPRLIAETGGQNALIADSSALPEQVVHDAMISAFRTAGQRCSALRLLFVQEEIADQVIGTLKGAMQELVVGDPAELATDIGPVIDRAALETLEARLAAATAGGRLLHRCEAPKAADGFFFPPCAIEVTLQDMPREEIFGPFLHVLRFKRSELDSVVDAVNATGYGLTLGVHSRLAETVARVRRRARVGNLYVNRDIIGAQVGVQPFGGERKSGTGPKAGGPNYLLRFTTERSFSNNTTATGGNATLVTLSEKGEAA